MDQQFHPTLVGFQPSSTAHVYEFVIDGCIFSFSPHSMMWTLSYKQKNPIKSANMMIFSQGERLELFHENVRNIQWLMNDEKYLTLREYFIQLERSRKIDGLF